MFHDPAQEVGSWDIDEFRGGNEMAWYDGTHSCGHEGSINLIGPNKQRIWKREQHFKGLCDDCFKKQREKENAEANAKAKKEAEAMELPELTGSEKQIAWATTLRQEFIGKAENWLKDEEELFEEDVTEYREALDWLLRSKTKSRFWIDTRRNCPGDVLKFSLGDVPKEEETKPEEAEVLAELEAEATVYPEGVDSGLVAEITIQSDIIHMHYPSRNETLRNIVKDLGYHWDDIKRQWSKKVISFKGPVTHRAAEVGNRLLNAGIPIKIADEEARQMAIEGTFQPECTRWVSVRNSGKHEGWFSISWKRGEDFYGIARRLPGSRWDNPEVLVPPGAFEDVLGLAETHGFKLSPGARRVVETEQAKVAVALKVKPKNVEPETSAPFSVPQKLDVPEEVGVDETLRDED